MRRWRPARGTGRIRHWDCAMFCPSCNTENDDRATFWRKCGKELAARG